MSRYAIPALQSTHAVIVGYDQPLRTFFANVEDLILDPEYHDPYIFQVGQRLRDVPTVEALATALAPYAVLPLDVLRQLRADQRVPYQRSALQERMVQFFAHQRSHHGD